MHQGHNYSYRFSTIHFLTIGNDNDQAKKPLFLPIFRNHRCQTNTGAGNEAWVFSLFLPVFENTGVSQTWVQKMYQNFFFFCC